MEGNRQQAGTVGSGSAERSSKSGSESSLNSIVLDFEKDLGLALNDEVVRQIVSGELYDLAPRWCEKSAVERFGYPRVARELDFVPTYLNTETGKREDYIRCNVPEIACTVVLRDGTELPHCEFRFDPFHLTADDVKRCVPGGAIAAVSCCTEKVLAKLTAIAKAECAELLIGNGVHHESFGLYAYSQSGIQFLIQDGANNLSDYFFRCGDVVGSDLQIARAGVFGAREISSGPKNEILRDSTNIVLARLPRWFCGSLYR